MTRLHENRLALLRRTRDTWLHENRLALLRRTRALLAQGWTQHVWARPSRNAIELDPTDRRAGCWCLTGAMRKALGETGKSHPILWVGDLDYLCTLLGFRHHGHAIVWNDGPSRTKRAVLARVDKAIAQIEAL